ncbi:MAG: VWA domain-containing protein [Prosthecobacter sp.]
MTFAHQHLLWFLLIIPALVGLKLWVDAHGSAAERLFTATRLRPALVTGRSLWRSWLVYAFYSLAMACLVVAVAQPRWGEEKLEVPDKGRNVFIALDTSRSMLARDVPPDRLTRARLAAHDLIMELAGERVGLLAFAGRAYLQAPLTTDHDAIIESLQAFDHTILEWGGSNIGDLLDVMLRAIKNLPKSNYALVIFSDGGDADQKLVSHIQRLTAAGVVVVTVGVGTEGGTLIPNPEIEGDYIRDESGNVVRSRLESGVLQQLASATGGRFLKLGTQPLNRGALQPVLDRLTEQQSANRQTSRPIERFAWPLGLGMLFLMLAWILSALPRPAARPVVLALAAMLLINHPPSAQAAGLGETLASILQRKGPTPEDARQALEQRDFKKARDLYNKLLDEEAYQGRSREQLLYGMAATEHALTNYDGSVKNFSEVLHTEDKTLRARAHRGLGHTLYDQGARGLQQQPKITIQRWTDALRHLDAALELDPDNEDVRHNREHVKKSLEQLRAIVKQMEEQQQRQGKGQKGQKQQKGQKGQEGEGQEGQEGDQEGEGKEGSDPNGSGDPKEPKNSGEKKGEDDGIGGKDAKELPEGRVQAANGDKPGDKEGQEGKEGQKPGEGAGEKDGDKKKQAQGPLPQDQRNPDTGYTPNEATGILRQYMDEAFGRMTNQQHTPPVNKKDW